MLSKIHPGHRFEFHSDVMESSSMKLSTTTIARRVPQVAAYLCASRPSAVGRGSPCLLTMWNEMAWSNTYTYMCILNQCCFWTH